MTKTSKNKIGECFYPLTEGEAREWYRLKYLGTTGYLLVIKRLITKPDADLVISNVVKFCQEWEITKSSFYRAINTLASDKKINWEATQGIVLKPCQKVVAIPRAGRYPTSGTVSHERDSDSHERDSDSHERDSDSHERDRGIYKDHAHDRSISDLDSDLNQISSLVPSEKKEGVNKRVVLPKEEPGVPSQLLLPEQPCQQSNGSNDKPYPGDKSSASSDCDNGAFIGHGNIAPDGKARPFNQITGKWSSVSSDPWMDSINPLKEFKQWVCRQAIAKGKAYSEANAAGEIRNNFQRASDLWDEYQTSLAPKPSTVPQVSYEPLPEKKCWVPPLEQREAFKKQLRAKKAGLK